MTRRSLPTITLSLSFALAACGAEPDDEPAPDSLSLEQRIATLAECEPSDLVVLAPWSGPAFDGETGELIEPLPEGHVEAVVNGWAIHDEAAYMLRMQHATMVLMDLFDRDGFLGFQGFESVECNIAASHSLWRDEASMYEFVVGSAHAAAMAQFSQMHHAGAGAHWTNPERSEPPTWREGLDRYVLELGGE